MSSPQDENNNKENVFRSNKINNNNNKEVTRDEASAAYLTNEALQDFHLVGTDGVRVAGNRYALAARSPVLQSLLLGRFQEADKKEVEVGYEGGVLQALVEYIYTDTAKLLDYKVNLSQDEVTPQDAENTKQLVSLVGAAGYYQLPRLAEKAEDALTKNLWTAPILALVALETIHQAGPTVSQSLEATILRCIRSNGVGWKGFVVEQLGPETLEEILQDESTRKTEYELFCILQCWADASNSNKRGAIASNLMKNIDLARINPQRLVSVVSNSGLVPRDDLYEAFKKQALEAGLKHSVLFDTPRSNNLPVWNNSKTVVSHWNEGQLQQDTTAWDFLLDAQPMLKGVFRWTIKIEKMNRRICNLLGVCPNRPSMQKNGHDDMSWRSTTKAWTYNIVLGTRTWTDGNGQDRDEYRSNAFGDDDLCGYPRVCDGQSVQFLLDLSPGEPSGGTLKASVDGGEFYCIFDGMRDIAKSEGGLIPAVRHAYPSQLRLLDIEKIA